MIAAALLSALLAASPEEPTRGDCSTDAVALSAEAEELLTGSGPRPAAATLARARELTRAARRGAPSSALSLRAADLAFAAGDVEEGGDLLAAAAEAAGPSLLSPPELLLLARRADERRRWHEAIRRYWDLSRSLAAAGKRADWIAARIRDLEVEAEAEAVAPPSAGPPIEARLALADGKRALAEGRLREAKERLLLALRLSPGYVEALLALGAVETRSGRSAAAVRAYKDALSLEPDRVETVTALANLLWQEPDRGAKEESLALLDRAVALRPDLRSLLRLSASRWAEFGDAAKALERLDRYLQKADPREREELASLRAALARRVRGVKEGGPSLAQVPAEEPTSKAVDLWRKAQVYVGRGDPESLSSALPLLAEAEKLDSSLARAPELAAAIHERRGEWAQAEAALRRAIRADASRASTYESLARILERDPKRFAEAVEVWRKAEGAGSSEALFRLAQWTESAGRRSEALSLYRRYRDSAPAGLHTAESVAAIQRLERRRKVETVTAVSGLGLMILAAGFAIYRLNSGRTFAEWLTLRPSRAQDVRPLMGRLRHEALKHGGLLLSDATGRLENGGDEVRRETAELLLARLYGESGSRGVIPEAENALSQLRSLAREDHVRLNLHRDPIFSWLLRGIRALRRARGSLRDIAESGRASEQVASRAARLLHRGTQCFRLASGAEIERALDRASALPVRVEALRALLARVAEEEGMKAPTLEPVGVLALHETLPPVRIPAIDWETIWRNLFGNALAGGRARGDSVRLGLLAQRRRDPITGEARLRIVLADDLASTLSPAQIRSRPADRGWGVIVELLRRNDGAFDVTAPPAPGFTKGIALDLPALEEPS
ncbi:MAG TPA: hypothetical protein VGL03_13465 [Thermoanaerobaculia bacterium]